MYSLDYHSFDKKKRPGDSPELKLENYVHCTVQSRFSDIKFSDNLWFSDYFVKTNFQFNVITQLSDSFCRDQKFH